MYKLLKNRLRLILAIAVVFTLVILLIDNTTTVLKRVYPLKYKEQVYRYAEQFNIDPYLVFAIIKAESSFDPGATSHRHAMGLMQITEGTGRWGAGTLGIEPFAARDLYDPEVNVKIGCWYLGRLMKQFNNNLELVIAAYNGGSGRVNEWLKDSNYSISGENLDKIPFKETDGYLKRVRNYHYVYKKLYERGF